MNVGQAKPALSYRLPPELLAQIVREVAWNGDSAVSRAHAAVTLGDLRRSCTTMDALVRQEHTPYINYVAGRLLDAYLAGSPHPFAPAEARRWLAQATTVELTKLRPGPLSQLQLAALLGAMPRLERLTLAALGPSSIALLGLLPDLPTLRVLRLPFNDLQPAHLTALRPAALPALQQLDLQDNALAGRGSPLLDLRGWHQLRRLELSHNDAFARPPAALSFFPPPHLEELALAGNTAVGPQLDRLPWTALGHLAALDLRSVRLAGPGAKALGRALPECLGLRRLQLDNNALCTHDIETLALGRLRHLRVLSLAHNRLTGPAIAHLQLANMDQLHHLLLADNPLTELGAQALSATPPKALVELDLDSCLLGPVGAACLNLGHFSHLQNLHLANNGLGPTGGMALASTIERAAGLELLNLSHNDLRPTGLAALTTRLPKGLTSLYLQDNKLTDEGMRTIDWGRLDGLTTLLLGANYLSDKGVRALPPALWANLTCLGLSHNTLGPASMRYLASAGPSRLQLLNLGHNLLADEGARHLASVSAPLLERIYLDSNGLTAKGVEAFVATLPPRRTRLWVAVTANSIERPQATALLHKHRKRVLLSFGGDAG